MEGSKGFLPQARVRPMRRALLAFQAGLYWSGAARLFIHTTRCRGAVILMYHSVAGSPDSAWIDPRNRISPPLFERQMAFLAARRRVVSLNELLRAHDAGESLPAGSVVLTFDDGYRDNLEVVAPILERHGFPAVLYLPTGIVGRGESPWADELYTIFRRSRKGGADGLEAYAAAAGRLIAADAEERRHILDELASELDPEARPPRLTLSWEEVRFLREHYPRFEVGVHSESHIDLTAHGEEVVKKEIASCIEDMERELGTPPLHFAYPYNRRNEETDRALRGFPLVSAVTAGKNCLITSSCDPLRLPRIEAPRSMTFFRYVTSGAYPRLSMKLVGRA